MGKLLHFDGITRLDLPASRIIERAALADLTDVVIVGFVAGGEEYFASSLADGGAVLWHLERAKLKLLRMADGEAC